MESTSSVSRESFFPSGAEQRCPGAGPSSRSRAGLSTRSTRPGPTRNLPLPPDLVRVDDFSCCWHQHTLNWPCTPRWAGKQRKVFALQGRTGSQGPTACGCRSSLGGVMAPAWPWRGCASKALLSPPASLSTSPSLPGGTRADRAPGKWGCAVGLQAGASLGKGPAVRGDAVGAICSHWLAPLPRFPWASLWGQRGVS